MKNSDHKVILFLGRNGFPFGSAGVNHSAFISKAIQESGLKILIVNHKAVHGKNIDVQIDMNGLVQGVPYQYTTFSPYKSESFIIRNLNKLYGGINEFFIIIKLKIRGQLKAFLIYLHYKFYTAIDILSNFIQITFYSINSFSN